MGKRKLTYADQVKYEICNYSHKRYGKDKYTLAEILDYVVEDGPKILLKLGTRLQIDEAQLLSDILNRKGFNIEPYDFPHTFHVWQSSNTEGIAYKHIAVKCLIKTLAEQKRVDYKSFEGFKKILNGLIWNVFCCTSINEWGTTLKGLGRIYNSCLSKAIIELIKNDNDFIEIKKHNLRPYDFFKCPSNMWADKKGNPTGMAREATKRLIQTLAKKEGVDYKSFEGFKKILSCLTINSFDNISINEWDTTLRGMISSAYKDSISQAIIDLINNDDDFKDSRKVMKKYMTLTKNESSGRGRMLSIAKAVLQDAV